MFTSRHGSLILIWTLKPVHSFKGRVTDNVLDFSKLFHWNTKLLFVYLVMEYETAKNSRNQLVVWDKIIRAKDFHRIDLNGVRPKYAPCDIDDKLPYNASTLYLFNIL